MKKTLLTLLFLPFTILAQVVNDDCSTATVLTVNSSTECNAPIEDTLFGSTNQTGILTCTGNAYADVWYEFTATANYHAISITSDVNYDLLGIAVYEGCPNIGDEPLYCVHHQTLSCTNLEIGTVYKVRIYSTVSAASDAVFNICVATYPNVVSVSESEYTVEELVSDVLLNPVTSSLITNISSFTGTESGINGIGYFNNNGGNFAFPQGLVLSTGTINNIPGLNTFVSNSGNTSWEGDQQLADYIINYEPDTSTPPTYYNASIVEFDFVPITNSVSFEFIFASEEYGFYQCAFTDAFAIFLTDITEGNEEAESINIATVPGTFTPVATTTIRDNMYNGNCDSENVMYFDSYNLLPTTAIKPGVPINFNGYTVPLTAQAGVVPGNTYHIKFVICDRADAIIDSAVFINGENFNLGTIEDNLTINAPTGNSLQLFAEDETLANLDVVGANIQWYADETSTTPLPESTLLTDGETYYASQTIMETESLEKLNVSVHLVTANDLEECDQYSDGFETFDLNTNNEVVYGNLDSLNYYAGYYLTYEDALYETNQIENPLFTNLVSYTQTLYVRLTQYNDPSNYAITTFELHTLQAPEIITPQDITVINTPVDLTVNNTEILNGLDTEDYTISFYNSESNAYAAGPAIEDPEIYMASNGEIIWIRVEQNQTGCFSVTSQNVYIAVPAPTGEMDQFFYAGETLSDLEVTGENIQWYENETSDTPLSINTSLEDGVTYYATQTINETESMDRLAVTTHQILSTEDQIFKTLTYFPNPISNILIISNANEISKLEVYNMLGQKVLAKSFNTTEVQLDMSSIETGIYLIKIISYEQQKIIRIQKQ